MKKVIVLAALFSAIATPAMAMPDELLEAGVYTPTATAVSSYTTVPNQDTQEAVQEFVQTWAKTNKQIEVAKKHVAAGTDTEADRKWLRFYQRNAPVKRFTYHMNRRLEFYRRAHNWNARNHKDKHYSYTMQPGQDEARKDMLSQGFTNSYGWNVLHEEIQQVEEVVQQAKETAAETKTPLEAATVAQAINDRVYGVGKSISNEELRYYLNELIWFSAKQATKEMTAHAPAPLIP